MTDRLATGQPGTTLPASADGSCQPWEMDTLQSTAARAAVVSRTRRVVRERATGRQSHRSRMRALSVPLLICGSLVVILCTAIWSLLSQYEASPTDMPDASNQLVVMLLWFLPALLAILALVFFRRTPEDVS